MYGIVLDVYICGVEAMLPLVTPILNNGGTGKDVCILGITLGDLGGEGLSSVIRAGLAG